MADGYRPIEDYALIGDGLTGALVADEGSIEWACFPRFDSPSLFAAILDQERGGAWVLRPAASFESVRQYRESTAILETTFYTATGSAIVLDFMAMPEETATPVRRSTIVRLIRAVEGEVEFHTEVRPAFDYARFEASWSEIPEGFRAEHGESSVTVRASVALDTAGPSLTGAFVLRAGQEAALTFTYEEVLAGVPADMPLAQARQSLAVTEAWWARWMARFSYEGPYDDAVRRSAITLKLLDYLPTGAIIAAVTTSLPERIGGVRNWDYRYAWLRDTAFTLYAFYVIGHAEESEAFLSWVMQVAHNEPGELQVLYGLEGETDLTEYELPHLEGYRGSRPVRVGNQAHRQHQLDIYGEIMDCAYLFQRRGGSVGMALWEFLARIVDYVCDHWHDRDRGIWEVRSEPQHFVYSKVLCWVALDRGIRLAEAYDFPADLDRWRHEAAAVRTEIFERGFNPAIGAFTQAYGSPHLDAAMLALPLRKFIDPADQRMISTVDAIAAGLRRDGMIERYRYESDDGLPGGEGAFLLVNFWLVDCYAEMGRLEDATELFEHLLSFANDVGLYAEEVDPLTGAHLGNFPQAFTHVALINAANSLGEAARARLRDAATS